MYIPHYARMEERESIVTLMREHNFATLVTAPEGQLFASHLPLEIAEVGEDLVLYGHLARSNEGWHHLASGCEALVIFQGPHAYISHQAYRSEANVPTWNYAVVHAYTQPRILDEPETRAALTRLVAQHEGPESRPLELPGDVEAHLLGALVAFELRVTRLEGKWKMSQNRSAADRAGVIASLAERGDSATTLRTMMEEIDAGLRERSRLRGRDG